MLSFIVFPDDFASSTLNLSSQVLVGLSPVLTLVIGVLLAVLVVVFLIHALHK